MKRRGIGLLAAAAALWVVARALFGPPAPSVRVVWVDPASGPRQYLENRFSLDDGEAGEGGAWVYALRDTSDANRRALATNPGARHIEGIDAGTFEIARDAPRAAWRERLVRAPEIVGVAIDALALVLALAGAAAVLLPPARIDAARARARGLASATRQWLARGIPIASPRAAAAFRIVFGIAVVRIVVWERVYPGLLTPLQLAQATGPYGELVRWIAANPSVVAAIQPLLAVTGLLFIAGVATRLSFAAFTAAVLVWASVFTLNISAHGIAALLLTLLALLPARWGDAWSIDAKLARSRGAAHRAPSRAYGYAFWVPGFVFGVAFAAAAWSKVREGPEWILNGTVKYHFVSDLEQAWVAWGPALTRWYPVALVMSASAVIGEALLITAAFSRSYAYRAALGIVAAMLLAGFALFQGVVWAGWWVLLLAFLPWHRIRQADAAAAPTPADARIPAGQLAAIALVAVQQVVVSAKHIEARPLFSAYDMYSTTYATAEDYERASNLVYRVVPVSGAQTANDGGCVVDDRVAEIARRAIEGSAADRELLSAALDGCLRAMPQVRQVALEGDRQVFDWQEARFVWKRRLDVIGPIDADRLRR